MEQGVGRDDGLSMKFVADRPFADPESAARKLADFANATEAVQDGRIFYRTDQCAVFEGRRHPRSIPRCA